MGTKFCFLGQLQEPHHNSKKSQKLIVRGKLIQKPRAIGKKKHVNCCQWWKISLTLKIWIPIPFQIVQTIMQSLAASNYNGRVGFSKMLYFGIISILMKAMENFNGVHTWLMRKMLESLFISSFSDLLFWLTKLWAHKYTEPGPRIFYTFWLLVKDSWKELGDPKTLLILPLEADLKHLSHYWAEDESGYINYVIFKTYGYLCLKTLNSLLSPNFISSHSGHQVWCGFGEEQFELSLIQTLMNFDFDWRLMNSE